MAEQGKICSIFIKKGKSLLKKESLKSFQNQQSRFPCRPSGRPEAMSGHKSQKVSVRYLSGRPIEREP
jgi:hypothetical protein